MAISGELMQELVTFLQEYLNDKSSYKAKLILLFGTNNSIVNNINWDTTLNNLIPIILEKLYGYGRLFNSGEIALCGFLKLIKEDLGEDIQKKINQLMQKIIKEQEKNAQPIEELEKSSSLTSEDLYHTLLRLGYRSQVRLFRKLIETESVAAFVIHGLPDYGQRWLLNRLVVQYVPYFLQDKIIKVNVSRKIRRNDISGLWREVAGRVGLKGKQYTPSEIAEQVYQCLQTQNVLLVFHEVETMPENTLYELIDGLWLPLISKIQQLSQAQQQPSLTNKYKLLMFLIDYEGCVENWKFPFTEQLTSHAETEIIFKAPIITEFSDNDLIDWIEIEYDKLPPTLTTQVDNKVQSILDNSNNGVPELVLETICTDCGCNWYEELEKWLKL